MSKSYAKYKSMGICCGHNTPWYRERRRRICRINNNRIRQILATKPIEEFDECFTPYKLPKKDTWREPTDGTIRYTAKKIKKLIEKQGYNFGLYIVHGNKVKK